MSKKTAEFAFDIHTGLSNLSITEFDRLPIIGMAATLSIHIKGLGEINYEVLRKVCDHYMSIPSYALKDVLEILAEAGLIRIMSVGKTITSIVPQIPVFEDVYSIIGDYSDSNLKLNEHEEVMVDILARLYDSPLNKDSLYNKMGVEKGVFGRCLDFGGRGGLVSLQKARGKDILVSPLYFADNLNGLVDAVAAAGAPAMESILNKIKSSQGWPISLVKGTKKIGNHDIDETELQLVQKLASDGIVKPPTIRFGETQESFLFTPKPGSARLNAANREIYERAMAIISAVRKGQLLPDRFKIHSPLALLRAFRDRGYLNSNSEAGQQYKNLVVLRVASLVPMVGGRAQLRLISTEENKKALDLAINLVEGGATVGMELDPDAQLALTKDEKYIQSLISSSELRRREKDLTDPQAIEEYQQLLLKLE